MKKLMYIVGTNAKCSSGEIKVADSMNVVFVDYDETMVNKPKFEAKQNVVGFQLYQLAKDGVIPMNFKFADGVIKGKFASLARFAGNKPLVVVSKVCINGVSEPVGYNVSDFNGKVSRVKKQVLVDHCRKCQNDVPIQNMQWVTEGVTEEYLREYSGDKFVTELIEAIVPNAKPIVAKETVKETPNAPVKEAKKPEISPAKQRMIENAAKIGLDAEAFEDPRWSVACITLIIAEKQQGNRVDYMMNPDYNQGQMLELMLAYHAGVDMTTMCDAKLTADEMYERRIRMEKQMWEDDFTSKMSTK